MTPEIRRLSTAPPERPSLDYAALREAGLEVIRELAGESWTDHNAHDPGITVLEALCYALTELGLRGQQEMADLLASGEAHAPAALVPAHRVLPSAPVTADDLRRLLLDHPAVADVLIATGVSSEVAFYPDPGNDPPFTYQPATPREPLTPAGLYSLLVEFAGEGDDLNSNTYETTVAAPGGPYTLELALPHWDEPQAEPFRHGAAPVTVTLDDPGTGPWRQLDEPRSYFAELAVDHDGPGGVESWVLLRIADELDDPPAVVPGILAAATGRIETVDADNPVVRFAARVRAAHVAALRLRRHLDTWRNLGEDHVALRAARVQEIAVEARLEVTGGSDLEPLLAEIFVAVDRLLSPPRRFRSLADELAAGVPVDEIFDGPLLRHGFLADLEEVERTGVVYVSDVLRLVLAAGGEPRPDRVAQENPGGRPVLAVSDLRLSNFVNNRPVTRDARDCLRLVETGRYRPRLSLPKSRLVLIRDDVEVEYDRGRVESLFRAAKQVQAEAALPAWAPARLPVRGGEVLPIEEYTPFQDDLPSNYAVGRSGLPATAGARRRAQALQARGYFHLFEQFLADATAQLGGINRFFSPDPEETASQLTRPLLDLPGVGPVIARLPAGGDLVSFAADPDNPHAVALRRAAESRESFIDRRNRMLDHLLARFGEEAVAWSQELHRRARAEVAGAGVPAAELATRLAARRSNVNARLLRDKAAFLADLPEMAARRLQAFGNPLRRRPEVVEVEADGAAFRWRLAPDGVVSLLSPEGADAPASHALAELGAEEAVVLAAQEDLYSTPAVPGGRIYRVTSEPNGSRVVGISPQVFPTLAAATAAAQAAAGRFADLRLATSSTPMERRVHHLTGIRGRERRELATSPDDWFALGDDTPGDGVVDRWTLHAEPGPAGEVLLQSAAAFSGADDAEATARARASVELAARHGLDDWSYRVAADLSVELLDPAGGVLARSAASFATEAAAHAHADRVAALIHRELSGEGTLLVEHLLLRPRQGPPAADPFLVLPDAEGVLADPYSHRLTLVLPSGWAREFTADGPRREAAPHRFRDAELRRHLERVVRQSCPAHLWPEVRWLDRDLASPAAPASFDGFEERYLTWLRAELTPATDPAVHRAARNALIDALVEVEAS